MNISSEHKQKVLHDSRNLWLDGIFTSISSWFSSITFEQHKEIFFELLEEWLDKGIIVFCPPDDPCNGRKRWDAETSEIIRYLKDGFPAEATHEDDMSVVLYFYEFAPAVAWRQPDGSYYGS